MDPLDAMAAGTSEAIVASLVTPKAPPFAGGVLFPHADAARARIATMSGAVWTFFIASSFRVLNSSGKLYLQELPAGQNSLRLAKVRLPNAVVPEQLLRLVLEDDLAGFDDVPSVCGLKCHL